MKTNKILGIVFFLLLLTCKLTQCVGQCNSKITGIHPLDYMHVSGGGDPTSLTDEQAGNDPENSVFGTPNKNRISNQVRFYPKYFGNQYRVIINLRGSHRITKIWYYVNNTFWGDSIFIFKGNPKDGFIQTGAASVAAFSNGWFSITVNDTTNFIQIGIKGIYQTAQGVTSMPDVSEMIFYGCSLGSRAATPADNYTGAKLPKKGWGETMGTNNTVGYDNLWYWRHKGSNRFMRFTYWENDDTANTLDRYLNYDHFNEGATSHRTLPKMYDSLNYFNVSSYTSYSGANARADRDGEPSIGWDINNYGDNVLAPSSYTWAGRFMWTAAAANGSTAWDTNLVLIKGVQRYSGANKTFFHEWNNEVYRWWGHHDSADVGPRYISPWVYLISAQMVYDGYESAFTPRIGIKNADVNSHLVPAGDWTWDTLNMATNVNLSRTMRSDGKNIFKVFNVHHYPQVANGSTGIHPVKDSTMIKGQRRRDIAYRIDSTSELWMSETGYDATQGSSQAVTPKSTAYTAREWQAICLAYLKADLFAARFDRVNIYQMNLNSDDASTATFETTQEIKSFPSLVLTPAYYFAAQMDSLLKDYAFDATISYGWQILYVQKFRHKTDPGKVCYFIGNANDDASTLTNQVIAVGGAGAGTKYELSFTSLTPTSSTITPSGGNITVSAAEKPYLAFFTEPTTSSETRFKRRVKTSTQ